MHKKISIIVKVIVYMFDMGAIATKTIIGMYYRIKDAQPDVKQWKR
jgi:hypothetical protein